MACSSKGLPNPSPFVNDTNALTFGSLLILFNSSFVNSPCKIYILGRFSLYLNLFLILFMLLKYLLYLKGNNLLYWFLVVERV